MNSCRHWKSPVGSNRCLASAWSMSHSPEMRLADIRHCQRDGCKGLQPQTSTQDTSTRCLERLRLRGPPGWATCQAPLNAAVALPMTGEGLACSAPLTLVGMLCFAGAHIVFFALLA